MSQRQPVLCIMVDADFGNYKVSGQLSTEHHLWVYGNTRNLDETKKLFKQLVREMHGMITLEKVVLTRGNEQPINHRFYEVDLNRAVKYNVSEKKLMIDDFNAYHAHDQ